MYNRVVFVAPTLNDIGGIEKTATEIKVSCEQANIEFSLFTLLSTPSSDFSIIKRMSSHFKILLLFIGKTFSFFIYFYTLSFIRSHLKEQLNDSLILSRNAAMTYALILLKQKLNLNCKIVYLPSHYSEDLYAPIIKESLQRKKIIGWLKNKRHVFSESFFEKKILTDEDSQVITFSYNLLNRLKNKYSFASSKTLRVIRPGVSNSILNNTYQKKPDDSKITFLYVGRVEPGKNVTMLLELFSGINQHNYHLNVVGDGSLLNAVQDKYKSNINIKFLGALFDDKLASEYKSASYLIIPTFLESYGHVISESLCSGTPVIGFHFPGCRNAVNELIEDGINGLVIKGRTQKDFDAMLIKSQEKIKYFQTTSKNLQKKSRKQFSWSNFIDELMREI